MKLRAALIVALWVLTTSCGRTTSVEEHEARRADPTSASGGAPAPGRAVNDASDPMTGEHAPAFVARTASKSRYVFDTVAGRYACVPSCEMKRPPRLTKVG